MARISESFSGRWMNANDIGAPGKTLRTTITDVTEEEVGQGNDKKNKLVVWLKDSEKGLVLNKTNGNDLAEILGDETDDWTGKKIVLKVERVEFQGKKQPGLRIDVEATTSANRGGEKSKKPARPVTQEEADEVEAPF